MAPVHSYMDQKQRSCWRKVRPGESRPDLDTEFNIRASIFWGRSLSYTTAERGGIINLPLPAPQPTLFGSTRE